MRGNLQVSEIFDGFAVDLYNKYSILFLQAHIDIKFAQGIGVSLMGLLIIVGTIFGHVFHERMKTLKMSLCIFLALVRQAN